VVPLFSGQAAQQVEAALASARVDGPIAVLGDTRLARHLAAAGRDVLCVAGAATRALRRARLRAVTGSPSALPLVSAGFAALVAGGLVEVDTWEPLLAEWCRAVAPGGLVVVVDRGTPTELSRRALCGGLTAIEQRAVGRTVITAGRWRPL
jgi:SAM-dependent methyltransferase